jgi:hydroxymethylglutaryl-CoA reductase
MATDSRLPQFRALSPAQRWDFIAKACQLSDEDRALLTQPGALPSSAPG